MFRPRGNVRRSAFALALLLLTMGLAGCLDGGDRDQAADMVAGDASDGTDADVGADGRPVTSASLDWDLEPYEASDQFTGSFLPHENGETGSAQQELGQERTNRRTHDITDLVPQGVPVRITVEGNADTGEGDIDIWLELPDGAWLSGEFDTPFGGYSRIVYWVLVEAGSVEAVIQYDEPGDNPEVPYTLDVEVAAHPNLLPPGTPLAVDRTGDPVDITLELEADPAEETRAFLYDAEGELLAERTLTSRTHTFTANEDAPPGRVVLLLSQGAPSATVSARSLGPEPATFERIDLRWESTPSHAVGDDGTGASWTFEVPEAPVLVGVTWSAPDVHQGLMYQLRGPTGSLIEVAFTNDQPNVDRGQWSWDTGLARVALQAGTYEASVQHENGVSTEQQLTVSEYWAVLDL